MIFNSLSLENFGIVKKFSRQFDNRILVLAGENGEGKSTILKAILLAVFDDYDGILADYVNWESDYFQVIVNFTHRGVGYESIVKYDGSTDRTLRFGDKVLKGDEAKKKLKEVIDFDLLKAGMLAMEQEIAIVKTKPAERREYLKRIYDIEFKRQLADLDNDIKVGELELAKKTTLQTEIENRKYSVPEKPELPFGKTDYELIKANLEIERNKLYQAEESVRGHRQDQAEWDALNRQRQKLLVDIGELSGKINANKIELDRQPEAIVSVFEEKNSLIKKAENELASIKDIFIKSSDDLNSEINGIILERLPVFNSEDFDSLAKELYAKKAKLAELEAAKDVCPACGQSISAPEHIAKRKKEISEITCKIAILSVNFEMLSNQKARRELAEKNNLEKTNRKTSLQHQLSLLEEKNKNDLFRIQSKIDQVRIDIQNIEINFAKDEARLVSLLATDTAHKDNLTTQLSDASAKLEELTNKLNTFKEINLDALKVGINKFESDIRLYDDTVSRIAEIERMEEQNAIQKANDLKQLEELKTDIQITNQLIGDWKMGIKILKTEFPVYVISRVIKDIEKSMNEFLKRTYPKYQVEVQDKKNALHIVYGPKKKDVSSASGFERQIFSLSFMYAISRAIGNKCWITDECDSAASEKNSDILYRVLGDCIGHGIDQIIIISHKSATRNILEFDYNAEVITFENGIAV